MNMYQSMPPNWEDINRELTEQAREARAKARSSQSNTKFLYPREEGTYVVRILPFPSGPSGYSYYVKANYHIIKSQSGEKIAQIICKRETFGKECPICKVLDPLLYDRSPEKRQFVAYLKQIVSRRTLTYFNAIFLGYKRPMDARYTDVIPSRNGEIRAGDLVVLVLPATPSDQIHAVIEQKTAATTIAPETGRCVIITTSNTGGRTTYNAFFDTDIYPVQNWLEVESQLYNLWDIITMKDIPDDEVFGEFYKGILPNSLVADTVRQVAESRKLFSPNYYGSIETLPPAEQRQPNQYTQYPPSPPPAEPIRIVEPTPQFPQKFQQQPPQPQHPQYTPPQPQTPQPPQQGEGQKRVIRRLISDEE